MSIKNFKCLFFPLTLNVQHNLQNNCNSEMLGLSDSILLEFYKNRPLPESASPEEIKEVLCFVCQKFAGTL